MDLQIVDEFRALNVEYTAYVGRLQGAWFRENHVRPRNVYEVLDGLELEQVRRSIARWRAYVTPLAESWWKERGWAVIWPESDTKPMQVQKLEPQHG